ncbi:hypothetical protein [Roseovarius sp. SYSU LYC5161]|uniref:hypothetical protein n=1 Tax=Roseovarius halophilus (ex Wu et al. 2025) TaxID=3376060 RepID=UPI00399B2515
MSFAKFPFVARCLASVFGVIVLSSAAQAQAVSDNAAVIDQIGRDNAARIEQTGSLNRAGAESLPMVQDGIFNDLDIRQTGTVNTVGLAAPGLRQLGRENTDRIFNRIRIEQTADGNSVGSVQQLSRGSVTNGANTLIIRQSGDGAHSVEEVRQEQLSGQAAQTADITQEGDGNRIALIDQFTNSVAQGQPNQITVVMRGVRNGTNPLTGYADVPGITSSGLIQEAGTQDERGNGHFMNLLIIGDGNDFGVRQAGRMNSVGFITVSGDDNQFGLRQDGTENDIALAPIEGDDNTIGVDQLGTNTALIDLDTRRPSRPASLSDRNQILVTQVGTNTAELAISGDDNDFTVQQGFDGGLGGDNMAEITVVGHANLGRVSQRGSNFFELDIQGSDNNNAGGFTGAVASPVLVPGDFRQTGTENFSIISVTGDANHFATLQDGSRNAVIASVNGNGNQFSVSQDGNGNIADIRQTGTGNTATVRQ